MNKLFLIEPVTSPQFTRGKGAIMTLTRFVGVFRVSDRIITLSTTLNMKSSNIGHNLFKIYAITNSVANGKEVC